MNHARRAIEAAHGWRATPAFRLLRRARCVVAILLLACSCLPLAASDDSDRFVESGGAHLRERMQIPWYDAEDDSLQAIPLRSNWEPRGSASWLARPVYAMLVVLVVVLALVLAWFIVRIIRERERGHARERPAETDPLVAADRIEALPFLRERSQHDLLGQARHHYEQGNFAEAIIYLFSYELVELDRSALVRLAKGKTNRQYLREAGKVRGVGQLLGQTMTTFEDVFFGRRPLDRAGFEACWSQLGQFETLVAQAQGTA